MNEVIAWMTFVSIVGIFAGVLGCAPIWSKPVKQFGKLVSVHYPEIASFFVCKGYR